MAAEQATILIPDISGYTEFVSKTEIDHSSHVLNHLLETIVESVSEDYVVSEIEGDAVLLYRKGAAPSKRELVDQCIKTFTAFHREIRGIGSTSVCQCGACQGAPGLTLKFVVHFGNISEIKVARFVKASGLDMVIAHRLLKNSIDGHEYLLMSRNYLDQTPDGAEAHALGWTSAVEDYPSIGQVGFDFATLGTLRAALPQSHRADRDVVSDDSAGVVIEIEAGFMEVLAVLTNGARRTEFVEGVRRVEQDHDVSFIGSKHTCVFDDFEVELEPVRIEVGERQADYYESNRAPALNVQCVVHSRLSALGPQRCRYEVHIYPEPGRALAPASHAFLLQSFEQTQKNLKRLMESGAA